MPQLKKFGIVFSGGGARGAYQAGVSRALYEIGRDRGNLHVFRILSGVSAGAINTAFLASHSHDLDLGTQRLMELWKTITAEQVFKTDYAAVTANAWRVIRGVSLGGISDRLRPKTVALLNTDPLRDFLEKVVDFQKIRENILAGKIDAVTVTATDYASAMGVTFVDAPLSIPMWQRKTRISSRAQLHVDHIMASSAIPLFFPPIRVGDHYFGDGCLRNTAPLSPAIHMGAERIVVIGVRKMRDDAILEPEQIRPSLGRILSVLINAIFMDAIETDLERLKIINQNLAPSSQAEAENRMRPVEALYLYPSQDLGILASTKNDDLPSVIRFLLGGLGNPKESSELLSYLLFEPGFCSQLVDLGYTDTLARRTEIEAFLAET